eukprot:Sspe_Gene.18694::Locus_6751_Transcript_1_4_Confidence_0.286_Length_1066::g.18694::m.18694
MAAACCAVPFSDQQETRLAQGSWADLEDEDEHGCMTPPPPSADPKDVVVAPRPSTPPVTHSVERPRVKRYPQRESHNAVELDNSPAAPDPTPGKGSTPSEDQPSETTGKQESRLNPSASPWRPPTSTPTPSPAPASSYPTMPRGPVIAVVTNPSSLVGSLAPQRYYQGSGGLPANSIPFILAIPTGSLPVQQHQGLPTPAPVPSRGEDHMLLPTSLFPPLPASPLFTTETKKAPQPPVTESPAPPKPYEPPGSRLPADSGAAA